MSFSSNTVIVLNSSMNTEKTGKKFKSDNRIIIKRGSVGAAPLYKSAQNVALPVCLDSDPQVCKNENYS